jgi:hypothetical protein
MVSSQIPGGKQVRLAARVILKEGRLSDGLRANS